MTLVYVDGNTVPDSARASVQAYDRVHWRNARLFRKPDRRATRVVTNVQHVREAYEDAGVPVEPLAPDVDTERYVLDRGGRGWIRVLDTETGEHVEGASTRDEQEAKATVKRLNANE